MSSIEKKIKTALAEKGLQFKGKEIRDLQNKEEVYKWATGRMKDAELEIQNMKFLKKYYTQLASLRYSKQPLLQKFKAEQFLEVERLFENYNPQIEIKSLTHYDKERWNRHLDHPLINLEKIRNSKVVIFGLGGIGSNVLLNLVYSGIYNYRLLDNDTVELSNLNRQTLYIPSDIGQLKADIAQKRLLEINPKLDVKSYSLNIDYPIEMNLLKKKYDVSNYQKIEKLIKWGDIVVNALDYYGAPYLINDLCIKYKKPFIWGNSRYFYGEIYSYFPEKTACFRCIFGQTNFFDTRKIQRYRTKQDRKSLGAVLGSTAIITGNIMGSIIINELCDINADNYGKYIILNTNRLEINKIPLYRHNECECKNHDR
ncbi:MAG: ThiF family adenylyltransferase [Candidatus Hermodarchaeota archaeon]